MPWHEKSGANILLRLIGIGILALAYAAAASLRGRALAGSLDGDALAYLLAAATFLCGSAGAALTFLGTHIFDRVELSQRWRHRDREE
jgi:hypothetical protein